MSFYFFTDTDQLFNQPENGEFGKITDSGTNSEKFQITSKHNCQVNAKAYAITDGLIMIQPNDSSADLVNIILKPLEQGVDTVSIDYFIYRGIKKASIFNGSLVKLTDNDLCIQVDNTIKKLKKKYPLDTHIPEEYILGHGAIAENDFLTIIQPLGGLAGNITLNEIFNTPNLKYNPFQIKGGSHIGDFNSEFGIDVVLKKAKIKISDARKSDNFIVSLKQTGLTGENLFENKNEKEKSLNYFDIFHFYSINYEKNSIRVRSSSESDFDTISIKKDSKNKFISLKNNFVNGDWVFIDIRNQYNNSLNYENNIAPNLAVKLGDTSTATYVNNYSYPIWPLLKFQTIGLNSICIKIPKSDFTPKTRAYFRDNNKEAYTFKAINFDDSNYSTELKLLLPKSPNGTTLGSYFYFMFLKEIDNDLVPTEWVIKSGHFVDTIFDVEELLYTNTLGDLKIKGIETFSKPTKWNIHDDNTFVFKNERSFVAKNAVAEDANNMYFFAFSNGESPQISSFDLPIVAGENDKPKFLEDVLLPKFNNSLSFYSYELEHNSNPVYVLKDNINGSVVSNSVKLSPNKNNFVLIAIDKQENLIKLKNAYLQFANNFPKRLVLKKREQITSTNGKKYWQATIFLVGYGNNTTTNSYQVKEVDTTIQLIYEKADQAFLGTKIFNKTYVKDELEINGLNFYGVIFKNLQFRFREEPFSYNNVNSLGGSGLDNVHFKILGKCRIEESTFPRDTQHGVWYYIELLHDVNDSYFYIETNGSYKKILKGTRCFINENSEPYIYTKYDKFIEDFISLNELYDSQAIPQNDTLNQRIRRIRQRSHNSDVFIFNSIISGSWLSYDNVSDSIYLNELTYENGTNVIFDSTQGPVGINLKIQLLADYSGVQFYNGEIADIQHLMVGLEVIDNIDPIQLIVYGEVDNINISLFSGDAGTVPASLIDMQDTLQNENKDAESFINQVNNISLNTANLPKLNTPIELQYYQHLQNKQFSRFDIIGDFYCFGLYYYKENMLYLRNSTNVTNQITTSSFIIDIFEFFNDYIEISEQKSLEYFYDKLNLNYNYTISPDGNNSLIYNKIIDDTIAFAQMWYFEKINGLQTVTNLNNPFTFLTNEEYDKVKLYSKISINEFIGLVNDFHLKFNK
jgi:hypothetical protein